jgi:branched-chain amino acid transport system ATP-binding protein
MFQTEDNYLSLRNLTVRYGALEAVKSVSLEVPAGKIVSLLGANGSGKSTILRAISGLKKPAGGEIWFQGSRIDGEPPYAILRRGIVHVPEGRGLFPYMTVFENLQMGAFSRTNTKKQEIERDLEEIYEYFPILKERRNSRAKTLSGGEAEMLALARGLMAKPKLLLLDEPLQGISPVVIKEIANIITMLNQREITILMVEHNISMSFELSQLVYILETGKLILQGKPQELSERDYVQKFYLGVT